ncbi:MAG: GerMN domain-containing protein [Ilumatobacter sp.]
MTTAQMTRFGHPAQRRMVGVATCGLVMALAVTACGVPTGSDSFEQIPAEDVPGRLADPTTTTSTTTTTTTTTTMPLVTPESTIATTTTIVPTQLAPVYFISRGRLRSIDLVAPEPAAATELTSLLEAGPQGPSEALLDSFVPEGLIIDTTTQRGGITIDLDPDVFERIRRTNQDEAIAQIVLTFLSNLVGVGTATFTFDGEPFSVPTGNSGFTDQPVSRDDYTSMLIDGDPLAVPEATTTSSTTTTTTTTVAPTTVAPTTVAPTTVAPTTSIADLEAAEAEVVDGEPTETTLAPTSTTTP